MDMFEKIEIETDYSKVCNYYILLLDEKLDIEVAK